MRKFRDDVRRFKVKTTMRFLEDMIQDVAKVDLSIHECQVHAGTSIFIE